MDNSNKKTSHKYGANRNEFAEKPRRFDKNFAQSKDIREDRGERQAKDSNVRQTISHGKHYPPNPSPSPVPSPSMALLRVSAQEKSRFVHLELTDPQAREVFVAGSFNEWNPAASPLKRKSSDVWELDLRLEPGAYEYRYIVDGQWKEDPAVTEKKENPFAGYNSVLHVRS